MPGTNGRKSLRHIAMQILSLAGLIDSGYLTWYHYDPAVRVCVGTSGCETVNTSPYAMVGPVPVAAIGVAGYLLIAGALLLGRWGPAHKRRAGGYAVYGLAILGSGFGVYLTAIEILVLHALCTWCVLSAALIVSICALATVDIVDHS